MKLRRQPREVAQAIVEHLNSADLVEGPEVARRGFINFVLRRDWLDNRVGGLLADNRVGVPAATEPRRFAIDYSSPNVEKEMHVGPPQQKLGRARLRAGHGSGR